ncbi:hypothetical protein [Streptomyces sp. MMS24-I29]|uniref:hypothetical protein n=1 Tax=Streptomyces sp. MMS24-I29 TaxID=3351480 RepID=UPI003C7E3A71
MRPKLSGWAQKVVSDKKLCKAKAAASTRLLVLTLATHTSVPGQLGPGVTLDSLAVGCPAGAGELQRLVDQLAAADWLTEAAVINAHLTGRVTERVLPLTCPLTLWVASEALRGLTWGHAGVVSRSARCGDQAFVSNDYGHWDRGRWSPSSGRVALVIEGGALAPVERKISEHDGRCCD